MESLGDNSEAYQSGLRQQIPFATGGLEPRLKVFSRGSQVAIREVSGRRGSSTKLHTQERDKIIHGFVDTQN